MAKREDSSGYLYHWIKATDWDIQSKYDSAFDTLLSIIWDNQIVSGVKCQKSKIPHVCMTESVRKVMVTDNSKYQPFGIEFYKNKIFSLGGRPVIYSTYQEKDLLHHDLLWRFVHYDPSFINDSIPYGIDFTWEREWRVPVDEIELFEFDSTEPCFHSNISSILVPSQNYYDLLINEIDSRSDRVISDIAKSDNEPYLYQVVEYYEEFNNIIKHRTEILDENE